MRTTRGRLGVMGSLPMLLGLGACGEAGNAHHTWDMAVWHAATLGEREGVAVLKINDDEVLFEGVPFEGTVQFVPGSVAFVGSVTIGSSVAGRRVFLVVDDPRGTVEVSVGGEPRSVLILNGEEVEFDGEVPLVELRFVVARGGEEVEFDGRRARLADGAKRAVFTKDGGVEVSDRE